MELIELGKNPISEQEPAGEDVRFEPDYEALSEEIEKLSSPTAAVSGIDWQKIVDLSQKILGEQSKDLLVACYLCVALVQTEQLQGLAQGIHILRDLLDNFWDTMFPAKKHMKGRQNALTWWKEKVDISISTLKPETRPKKEREGLLSDLNSIDDFLGENMEDAPILHSLIEEIGSLVTEEQEQPVAPSPEEKEAPPVEKEEKSVPPAAAPAAVTPVSLEGADLDPEKLLEEGLDLLSKASTLLAKQNLFDPVPYRLNRIVAWLTVKTPPPADGGKTMLPPPDGQIISSLKGLYESGNWQDLLEAAESHVPQFLFWLDLSRYVAEALEQLGHSSISEGIAIEAGDYLRRLPGIERLCFSDGTPFADEETREWLRELSLKGAGREDASTSSTNDSTEQMVSKELAGAQKMLKDNKLVEALTALKDHMERSVSVRDQFLWQLGVCRFLLRAKKVPLAIPYIEKSLGLLDEYKIERWEPGLAVKALEVSLIGLRLDEGKKDEALLENILKRISVLDPVRAMELI